MIGTVSQMADREKRGQVTIVQSTRRAAGGYWYLTPFFILFSSRRAAGGYWYLTPFFIQSVPSTQYSVLPAPCRRSLNLLMTFCWSVL